MSEPIRDGTPFKQFVSRVPRRCNQCKKHIDANTKAWKPSRNAGSWMSSAVLCDACVGIEW